MKSLLVMSLALLVLVVSFYSGPVVSFGEEVVRSAERGRYRTHVRRNGTVVERERHRSRTVTRPQSNCNGYSACDN